ncbi:hypothetical protein [Polaribacter sp. SA4-12]|uniref:hypothetical protein n=1 Tax=Polaribacter sp. SA4-12 TaxID=1312072 RepID=UPI000B3D0918|nr:hypothetical protein [Polaribacter sp. SA4-12]ARV14809.1 hypothetical protein BTO07_06440 [Polaribacter sp. SA4-12]
MNYGEKVLEIYNKEFLILKKDFIKFLKNNFESEETFPIIIDKYLSKLYKLQEAQYSKDRLLTVCSDDFWFRYNNYNKNAVKNTINKNVLARFKKNLSRNSPAILEYPNFIEALAKLSIANDFEKRIRTDIDEIEIALDNKDVSKVFKVKKKENAEYLVEYSKPYLKPKKELETINTPKKENKSITPINPFSKDEKFILIHYMLSHERTKTKKLSTYEITLILKITNECFSNKDLVKKKDTDYEKLHKGYNYYTKTSKEKKELMEELIEKVNQYSFTMFTEYLSSELHKL